ncbi:MAG: glycosyltransferase [Candidatus Margulisiibacteriota bacterium]|nr:glycosyltransferase [Candidatus Margulisiibacteriota bacterium]
MKLSACMIVKNEKKMLEKTLPGLSKYADEIILVDTGSNDDTIKVAEKYGAKVFYFPWVNDFSAARNESIKAATGDWILWIDADEYMREEDLKELRGLIEKNEYDAFALTMYESKVGTCENKSGYKRAKVFKNGLGYHFIRPINEQLVDGSGKTITGEDIPVAIYHWGKNLEESKMDEKRKWYVEHYSKALEKTPNDPYLHFLLANNLNELKRDEAALVHYTKTHELSTDKEIVRQALEKKADLLLRMKKLSEAAKAAEAVIKLDPKNIPARNVFASIYLVAGKIDTSIEILTEILNMKLDGKVENIYQNKAMPNFLLGKAYELKGEKEKAKSCYAKVRKISPELMGAN